MSSPAGRLHPEPSGGLWVPPAWRARLVSWARSAAPREACGLLLGAPPVDPTGVARVERALWSPNLERRADRYELDPVAHLAGRRLAEASGLELLGAWHSHPLGAAEASAADRGESLAGWWYVIVGLRGPGAPDRPRAELAAYRARRGDLVRAPLLGAAP